MLEEAPQALAAAGGAAIVGTMATDAWTATRGGVARLFGRGQAQRQAAVEALLDQDAQRVENAPDGARERQELALEWQDRLANLLREYPDAVAELPMITQRIAAQAPSVPISVQHNAAGSNSTLYAVQGGNQNITHSGPPPR